MAERRHHVYDDDDSELDQDAPHDLRRDGKEMNTIPPMDSMHVDQPQIGLVDQGRGMERMIPSLARHHAFGESMELAMNERYELLECRTITIAPGQEQLGDVAAWQGA